MSPATTKEPAHDDAGDSALRLLIVEDERTQCLLLERQLQGAGYRVETAQDGNEALARVLGESFQILITDWDMPGIDGATLCRRIREAHLPGYLYILLLTGHDSPSDVVAGLQAGADDYVKKPARAPELLARLKTGSRIVQLERSLRASNEQVRLLSITDALAGTYNRRYLNDQLVREIERSRRYSRPLSVVMADIDHFKRIKDEYGHPAGDEVLRGFADLLRASIRQSDWIARYGGEEFIVVVPDTDLMGAMATAEKIRLLCVSAPMPTARGRLRVTASFGVAVMDPKADTMTDTAALLGRADAALYRSKNAGRNCVTCAADVGLWRSEWTMPT
jgi:two-component system, cell cycle response regulator